MTFLCSLDDFLLKNAVFCFVLFFWNQISKWRSLKKNAIFDLLFTFFYSPGKRHKNSFSTYLTYIHVFWSPYWVFLPYQFGKNYEFTMYGFSLVWLLVLILFRAILEQSINNKCWARFGLECLLLISFYTNGKYIVFNFVNPGLWMMVGLEASVQYRKRKKALLL